MLHGLAIISLKSTAISTPRKELILPKVTRWASHEEVYITHATEPNCIQQLPTLRSTWPCSSPLLSLPSLRQPLLPRTHEPLPPRLADSTCTSRLRFSQKVDVYLHSTHTCSTSITFSGSGCGSPLSFVSGQLDVLDCIQAPRSQRGTLQPAKMRVLSLISSSLLQGGASPPAKTTRPASSLWTSCWYFSLAICTNPAYALDQQDPQGIQLWLERTSHCMASVKACVVIANRSCSRRPSISWILEYRPRKPRLIRVCSLHLCSAHDLRTGSQLAVRQVCGFAYAS